MVRWKPVLRHDFGHPQVYHRNKIIFPDFACSVINRVKFILLLYGLEYKISLPCSRYLQVRAVSIKGSQSKSTVQLQRHNP